MEIIVVDGLTENIMNWITKNFSDVHVIHFDDDKGIPFRLNAALNKIHERSRYVAILAEDMEVREDWLDRLVEVMESDGTVGFAQPLLLRMDSRDTLDSGGCVLDYIGYPYKKHVNKKLSDIKKDTTRISYGEVGLINRKVIKLVSCPKPFDSDYFMHWFDVDFSWKLQLAGYKIVVVPSSIVYHERRISGGRSRLPSRNIFLNTRNQTMTLVKNYDFKNLVLRFPSYLTMKIIESLVLLRTRPDHSLAIIHGLAWTFLHLRTVWEKRQTVQRFIRKTNDAFIIESFMPTNPSQLYRSYKKHYP